MTTFARRQARMNARAILHSGNSSHTCAAHSQIVSLDATDPVRLRILLECHFDIAGTAWGDRNLSYHNKGAATGEVIRLVIDLLGI